MSEAALVFDWIHAGRLAVSAFPEQEEEVRWLHAQGIQAIVTLTETPLTYAFVSPAFVQSLGLVLLHEPIDSLGVPDDFEVAYRVMEFVDERLTAGQPVLIHCLNGTGRTGVMLYVYALLHNLTLEEAKQQLKAQRPACAWERMTPFQCQYIEQFDAHLHGS